jgi:cytochrome b561/polyisoprenoid-binding protein YceI
MPARNTTRSYGSVSRTFHWLTALLILAAFPLGVIANDMAYDTAAAAAEKARLFSIHKTVGVAVFFVALARIAWAFVEVKPAGLHPGRRVETFLAEVVHWALYLSLVVVPLSGWVHHAAVTGFAPILWPFGQGLPFVPVSEAVAGVAGAVHWLFTKVLFAAVALHVAGAMRHAIVDRDLVLARMAWGAEAGTPGARHGLVPAVAAVAIFATGGAVAWQMAAPSEAATAEAAAPAVTGGNWQVAEGSLGLTVRQMGADVAGALPGWTAVIDFDDSSGTGRVRVEIDMAQVTIGSVTDQARGPEFLDVAAHPVAVFEAEILPVGETFEARGTLRLRGAEVPVVLPFTLDIQGETARMAGALVLDRRDFGMGASYGDEATVGFAVQVAVALTAQRMR